MKILHLNLKKEYFDAIKSGEKKEEYRQWTDYWCKRLMNREYDEIHIKCGYPKKGDMTRTIIKPWNGFTLKKIIHPHFNNEEVTVFAIAV